MPGLTRPLEHASAELVVGADLITYRGQARVAGAPVWFDGDAFVGTTPRFRVRFHALPEGLVPLQAALPKFQVPAGVQVPGRIDLDGSSEGWGTGVASSGTVRIERASAQDVE